MIFTILYFFLPAAAANMAAALSAKLFPNLNYPLDFNKKFRGIRILGNHKTIRGFIFGIICATTIYLLQIYAENTFHLMEKWTTQKYANLPLYFGALLGLGAVTGDSVKSFFKRQLKIAPGGSWIPFDQIDWVLGAIVVTEQFVYYSPLFVLTTLVLFLFLHIGIKYIGYKLHLDSAPL